jgi:hypothetical protein
MKKVISGILCAILLLLGAVSAQAATPSEAAIELPQLRSAYTNTTITTLGISGGQATCEGSITGYSGITTKVKIELYLERKTASSSTWSPYASGSKTVNSYIGAYQLKVAVTSGYQYRVRGVYTAWSGTKSESLTSYSGVVTY